MTTPTLIYGGASITKQTGYQSLDDVNALLDVLEQRSVKVIDTSMLYAESEVYLGQAKASSRFTIDTKVAGMAGPLCTKDSIVTQGKESLRKLGTSQVDVYYMHSPETRTSLEDYLGGINALYESGAFKRFGLSNYDPKDVEAVIRVCKEHNYVLPTVYQGIYNALSRRPETDLLPLLRRHNIAFYAYSPIAGGFLAKTSDELRKRTLTGRWSTDTFAGRMYYALYAEKPSFLRALDRWHEIAAAEGLSGAELAYRWAVHHSALDGRPGDAVIIGSRTVEQTEETLDWIGKGPLSGAVQMEVEALWEPLRAESVLNSLEALDRITGASGEVAAERLRESASKIWE